MNDFCYIKLPSSEVILYATVDIQNIQSLLFLFISVAALRGAAKTRQWLQPTPEPLRQGRVLLEFAKQPLYGLDMSIWFFSLASVISKCFLYLPLAPSFTVLSALIWSPLISQVMCLGSRVRRRLEFSTAASQSSYHQKAFIKIKNFSIFHFPTQAI